MQSDWKSGTNLMPDTCADHVKILSAIILVAHDARISQKFDNCCLWLPTLMTALIARLYCGLARAACQKLLCAQAAQSPRDRHPTRASSLAHCAQNICCYWRSPAHHAGSQS